VAFLAADQYRAIIRLMRRTSCHFKSWSRRRLTRIKASLDAQPHCSPQRGAFDMKTERVWVLVADSSRARIIRSPELRAKDDRHLADLVLESEHKPAREIMADKPGRSIASVGARRSAMEYRSDPVRLQTEQFAGAIADQLERRRAAGEFDRIVVVAEPRTLGAIRRKLPQQLAATVAAEVAKDLTKLPPDELRAAIVDLNVPGLRVA
jgi:protein required for attachment to host cells